MAKDILHRGTTTSVTGHISQLDYQQPRRQDIQREAGIKGRDTNIKKVKKWNGGRRRSRRRIMTPINCHSRSRAEADLLCFKGIRGHSGGTRHAQRGKRISEGDCANRECRLGEERRPKMQGIPTGHVHHGQGQRTALQATTRGPDGHKDWKERGGNYFRGDVLRSF